MHPAIIIGTVRSLIVDVAMGQIPHSTERISSLGLKSYKNFNRLWLDRVGGLIITCEYVWNCRAQKHVKWFSFTTQRGRTLAFQHLRALSSIFCGRCAVLELSIQQFMGRPWYTAVLALVDQAHSVLSMPAWFWWEMSPVHYVISATVINPESDLCWYIS